MLNRREFLTTTAGGFVTLLLTPLVSACTSETMTGTSTTTTNTTVPGCDGAGETSTVAQGHTHTLCVPASDLSNPPASGATYSTSLTDGHQHTVTLIQAWLMAINQGHTVNITTSSVSTSSISGHTHDFAIQKVAATVTVAPPPNPPVSGPHY